MVGRVPRRAHSPPRAPLISATIDVSNNTSNKYVMIKYKAMLRILNNLIRMRILQTYPDSQTNIRIQRLQLSQSSCDKDCQGRTRTPGAGQPRQDSHRTVMTGLFLLPPLDSKHGCGRTAQNNEDRDRTARTGLITQDRFRVGIKKTAQKSQN